MYFLTFFLNGFFLLFFLYLLVKRSKEGASSRRHIYDHPKDRRLKKTKRKRNKKELT